MMDDLLTFKKTPPPQNLVFPEQTNDKNSHTLGLRPVGQRHLVQGRYLSPSRAREPPRRGKRRRRGGGSRSRSSSSSSREARRRHWRQSEDAPRPSSSFRSSLFSSLAPGRPTLEAPRAPLLHRDQRDRAPRSNFEADREKGDRVQGGEAPRAPAGGGRGAAPRGRHEANSRCLPQRRRRRGAGGRERRDRKSVV